MLQVLFRARVTGVTQVAKASHTYEGRQLKCDLPLLALLTSVAVETPSEPESRPFLLTKHVGANQFFHQPNSNMNEL